jgi:hypothetical protein
MGWKTGVGETEMVFIVKRDDGLERLTLNCLFTPQAHKIRDMGKIKIIYHLRIFAVHFPAFVRLHIMLTEMLR